MMNFFNNPNKGSFKDWLASIYSFQFLATCVKFMIFHQPEDLQLIAELLPLEILILGGYFAQEVSTGITQNKLKVEKEISTRSQVPCDQ
jgi:hypothetical protein